MYKVEITNNNSSAPTIYVDAIKEKDAVKEAKIKSGLSRFNSWNFNAVLMPKKHRK